MAAMPRLHVARAAALLLGGCTGDPPPDPEVQPLEVVVGNPDPEHGPCLLNVSLVAAGTHEVTTLSMTGSATVRIVDPSGRAVLTSAVAAGAAEGGGSEVLAADDESVRLGEGPHRVECVLATGTHIVELLVVPTRPGYRQGGGR